jgi:hypothetical protein
MKMPYLLKRSHEQSRQLLLLVLLKKSLNLLLVLQRNPLFQVVKLVAPSERL